MNRLWKGRSAELTGVLFAVEGSRLLLAKARQQEKKKDGHWPSFGALEIYSWPNL